MQPYWEIQTQTQCVYVCLCLQALFVSCMIHHGRLAVVKNKRRGNTWFSPSWRGYKCVRGKKKTRRVNKQRSERFQIVDAHGKQGGEQRWFQQTGLCLPAPPLPQLVFSFPPFSKLLGVSALCGNLTSNTHTLQLPSPHPLPASLACRRLVGIPALCCAMI